MDDGTRPKFLGDEQDLRAFRELVSTRRRSAERERALRDWQGYKLGRQAAAVRKAQKGEVGKNGARTKGEYVRSLTTPAIDLRGAYFEDLVLGYADLRAINLDGALIVPKERQWIALKGANLECASLRGATLRSARLMGADLRRADLSGAKLIDADLSGANLAGANLSGADLSGANLRGANLVHADLRGANLCGCRVYGVSAWDVQLDDTSRHEDLIVTPEQPEITVDNIEIAQFVYLLLSNPRIRGALDTVCRKGVLILGRFTRERKAVLDGLREALRSRDFVPMIFDFDKPTERDFSETIRTLAGMSRFIIADITNPRSSPLELGAVVPDYAVPLVPILAAGEEPFSMFKDLKNKYPWVLDPISYESVDDLIEVIEPAIIVRALAKHAELLEAKAKEVRVMRASDYRRA